MLRKAIKLTTLGLIASSALTATAFAGGAHRDYKGMAMPKSRMADQVFVGYTFTHHDYNSTWENSYRALTGKSPENNYSGMSLGMDHMMNDWLALHVKFSHYFRKGSNQNEGRLSGLTVGGMGYYHINNELCALGMVGATVGVFSHNGDKGVGTANPSFTDADVNLALGLGLQYAFADRFAIRPMFNIAPFQDRADSDYSLGFSVDLVYSLA